MKTLQQNLSQKCAMSRIGIYSRNSLTLVFLALLTSVFLACASTRVDVDRDSYGSDIAADELARQADSGDIFDGFAVPKAPTIGILKPQGAYLSPDEQWIPDMIKSAMNNNFRRFAAGRIMVMNLADEQSLEQEVNKSLSGSNDELSLTSRRAARSLMTGKVTKIQGTTRFNLEFTVTDTETHAILATYSQNHSDIELSEGIAVNKAAESLLKDLDVKLNEAGRYLLYGASNAADTALAKGLSAAASGQGLQAMNYLYNAASYNYTASQAAATLATVQNQNQKDLQGAGAIVMDFFERQELWQNRLNEFNDFYGSHAPFELFYTPPAPADMRGTGDNRTYSLAFQVGLRWNQNQISAMEKVLQEYILKGLYLNPREDIQRWDLKGLPENAGLFRGPDNIVYDLYVSVENERGEEITSGPVRLNGSLYWYQDKIYASCTQVFNAEFPNIPYSKDQITPQLYIRIVSINGLNIKTVGENGFTRVTQTQGRELPPIQRDSLPAGLLLAINKENAAVRGQERDREREQQKQGQEQSPLNRFRFGIGAAGGAMVMPGVTAANLNVNAEVGWKFINGDLGFNFFLGPSTNKLKESDKSILGFNLGLSYAFIGKRWLATVGPGMLLFVASEPEGTGGNKKTTYTPLPYLQGRFSWGFTPNIFVWGGYRLDLYPRRTISRNGDDKPLSEYFSGGDFSKPGNRNMVHNILVGLTYYIR